MKTTKTLTRKEWRITFTIVFFTFLFVIFFGGFYIYFLAQKDWLYAMAAASGLCLTLREAAFFYQKYAT